MTKSLTKLTPLPIVTHKRIVSPIRISWTLELILLTKDKNLCDIVEYCSPILPQDSRCDANESFRKKYKTIQIKGKV